MSQLIPFLLAVIWMAPCFPSNGDELGQRVSLFRLIVNPDSYHEKVVFVTGYVRIGLEDMSICPSRDSLSNIDCLWLNIDDGPFETDKDMERYYENERKWNKFNKSVVSIRATFDKNETGHMGGWSGGLTKITQVFGRKGLTEFRPNPTLKRDSPSASSSTPH